MPIKHKALAPKRHASTRRYLRHVDCSCGWGGRITAPAEAQAEWERHAAGEVLPWEIEAAHYDAMLEDRRRSAAPATP